MRCVLGKKTACVSRINHEILFVLAKIVEQEKQSHKYHINLCRHFTHQGYMV